MNQKHPQANTVVATRGRRAAGPALKISCGDVTLPTHSWISTADREEILRLLERYDRARSSLG